MIIKCEDCSAGVCAVNCSEGALTLAAGDLLVVTEKCAVCKRFKGYKLPDCIAGCKKASIKVIVDEKPVPEKRSAALKSFSSLGVIL
jgi:hypothetical protein